jgi:hypothetical protein
MANLSTRHTSGERASKVTFHCTTSTPSRRRTLRRWSGDGEIMNSDPAGASAVFRRLDWRIGGLACGDHVSECLGLGRKLGETRHKNGPLHTALPHPRRTTRVANTAGRRGELHDRDLACVIICIGASPDSITSLPHHDAVDHPSELPGPALRQLLHLRIALLRFTTIHATAIEWWIPLTTIVHHVLPQGIAPRIEGTIIPARWA